MRSDMDMDSARREKDSAVESNLARDIRKCARWMIENSDRLSEGSARLIVDKGGTAMTLATEVGRKPPTVAVNGSYIAIGCDDE